MKKSIIPGFALTMTMTLFWVGLIVVIPLLGLVFEVSSMTWADFIKAISGPRMIHAYQITILASFAAAIINVFLGLLVSWVLSRYRFLGRRLIDALIDLPFALPTAIAGIALTTLYAPNGLFGHVLSKLGIDVSYTPLGIVIALLFVGFPFVVRVIQPVLQDFDPELEEAAMAMGATRWQCFSRIIFPYLIPALLTGFSMSFARGLGEFGSVIFIAGNMPMRSEVVSLMIYMKLEQYDLAGASAVAFVSLIFSLFLLLLINYLQHKITSRSEKGR